MILKNSVISFHTRIHNVNEHSWVELYKLFELQGYSASPTIKIMASIVPAGLLLFVMYINLVHVLPFKVNSDSEGKI